MLVTASSVRDKLKRVPDHNVTVTVLRLVAVLDG